MYSAAEVELAFGATTFSISALDHLGKSVIVVTFDCAMLSTYYCEAPLKLWIKRANLDKVASSITKASLRMTILLLDREKNLVRILIKNGDMNSDDWFDIETFQKPGPADLSIEDSADYPIKFRLDSKHFKIIVNMARRIGQLLIIKKRGDEPLQISSDRAETVGWVSAQDSDNISLRSTIAPTEVFNVSVPIEYVRPFSHSCAGAHVEIAADSLKKLSFTSHVDGTKESGFVCTIQVRTEIKNFFS
jgi:hypothetical protein